MGTTLNAIGKCVLSVSVTSAPSLVQFRYVREAYFVDPQSQKNKDLSWQNYCSQTECLRLVSFWFQVWVLHQGDSIKGS